MTPHGFGTFLAPGNTRDFGGGLRGLEDVGGTARTKRYRLSFSPKQRQETAVCARPPAGVRGTEGIERLRAMCETYLAYVERRVFPGGCFFASLVAEMDARAGPVHDLVVSIEESIVDGVANLVRQAQRRGEIKRSVDPRQLAFELEACVELANYHFILFGDRKALDRGRNAVTRLLDQARTRRRDPS